MCDFNRYFESKQFDESMLTIKQHLNIYINEISTVIDKYLECIVKMEKEYQTLFIGNRNDNRK